MTRSKQQAVNAVRDLVGQSEPRYPRFRGWLKAIDGSVHVSGRSGYVYVQRRNVGASVQTEQVRMTNVNVPDIDGFPVIVGRDSVSRETDVVLGRDHEYLVDWLYDYVMESHHEQHEAPDGFDIVWVRGRAIVSIRVSPQLTADLSIRVAAGVYSTLEGNAYFNGNTNYNLSANVPSWGQRFVLIGINQNTGTLSAVNGTIKSNATNLTASDVPTIPCDLVTLACIRMYRAQTTITETEIWDFSAIRGWAGSPDVYKDGVLVVDCASSFDFTGDGVTVTADGHRAIINITSGGAAISVHDHSSDPEGGQDLQQIKTFQVDNATTLTINAGAITVTQIYHAVDTEGAAARDNLDTINGGAEGDIIILQPAHGARTVVLRHNVGNIKLSGQNDIELRDVEEHIILIYNADGDWCDDWGGYPDVYEDGILKVSGTSRFYFTGDISVTQMGPGNAYIGVTSPPSITAGDWMRSSDGGLEWSPDSVALLRNGVLTEYADPDDAFAAADTVGDVVLIPPGTWTLTDAHTLTDVSVIGLGNQKDCVLYCSGDPGFSLLAMNGGVGSNFRIEYETNASQTMTALDVASGCELIHVEGYCLNVGSGDAEGIGMIESYAYDCYGEAECWGGNCYGFYMYSSELMDCEGRAKSRTVGVAHGIFMKDDDCFAYWTYGWADGTNGTNYGLTVEELDNYAYHCVFAGDDADINLAAAATLYIYDVQHTVQNLGAGATITQLPGDRAGTARDEIVTGQWTFDALSPATTHEVTDTDDAAVTEILRLLHNLSAGTAAAGMGARQLTQLENDNADEEDAVAVDDMWSDATDGSEDSYRRWLTRIGGAALAEVARLDGTAFKSAGSLKPTIGSTTEAEKWGSAYLALGTDILPDGETSVYAGLMRRFINKTGIAAYDYHRGVGAVVPGGCTVTATPVTLWATWLGGFWGWFFGTYYAHFPNHATLPAVLTVIGADPLPAPTVLTARLHVTGGCRFGLWVDNYDVDRNYNIGDYVYRYDVYLWGNVCATEIYTQCATSICTVGGVGAAATFAAWVNHAGTGPYGPFSPCGEGIILRLRANHAVGTGQCYPYVIGEQGATSGLGGSQILYDDAWPGTNPYDARRMGTFQRTQGYAWSGWDWYNVD